MNEKDPEVPWTLIAQEIAKRLDIASLTIERFCNRNGLSQSFYHKMQSQDLGPDEMKIGAAVRISLQAERRWQRQCERRRKEARSAATKDSVDKKANKAESFRKPKERMSKTKKPIKGGTATSERKKKRGL